MLTETLGRETLSAWRESIPGIYQAIPADEYHAHPAISSSPLKKVKTHSPFHAKAMMEARVEVTEEMTIGGAVHCRLFTPSEFDSCYMLAPNCGAQTGEGKPCRNSAIGKDGDGVWLCGVHARKRGATMPQGVAILADDAMDRVKGIVGAVESDPKVRDIFGEATDFELSILSRDDETGELLKCRMDIYCRDIATMPDLKTCRSAKPGLFKYQARDLAYPLQLAFYRHVARLAGLEVDCTPVIAAENIKPFAPPVIYDPSADFMAAGVKDFRESLTTIIECRKSGIWPTYATTTQTLDLP